MVSRRIFVVLLYGLAVLVVVFAVLMAFFALVSTLGDAPAAQVLLWIGISCLILIISDLVLLVGCLGINAVAKGDDSLDQQ